MISKKTDKKDSGKKDKGEVKQKNNYWLHKSRKNILGVWEDLGKI